MRPRYITATRSADVLDHAEVVRDEDVGQAELLAQVFQQVDDLRLDGHVECAHGLVADDQLRAHRQRPRDADALALAAARTRAGSAACGRRSGPPSPAARTMRSRTRAASWPAVDGQALADDGAHRHARVQRGVRVLEDDLHVARQRTQLVLAHGRDVAALEPHLARRWARSGAGCSDRWCSCRSRSRRPRPGFRRRQGRS
jgi:hypothetical protein